MYGIGDKIISKKVHPCGGREWVVIRNGADYKIKCTTCGRVIMLTPDQLKKIVKNHLPGSEEVNDGRNGQ